MAISVILADDHPVVREGLAAALEGAVDIDVIATASNGREATELARAHDAQVVVMDISMPDLNGIDATRTLQKLGLAARVIGLSAHTEGALIKAMLQAGARGYVRKDAPTEELITAIRAVAAGGVYISPTVAGSVLDDYLAHLEDSEARGPATLSSRERQVLQLLAEGVGTQEIAERLSLSVKTIESHRKRIMDKLDIRTVAGLTKFAIREGITSLS